MRGLCGPRLNPCGLEEERQLIAIISDVHANLEAFETAMTRAFDRNVEEVICLGDVVGYGANPVECLRAAKHFDVLVMGNHEEAVVLGTAGFTEKAAAAVEWTKEKLTPEDEVWISDWPRKVERDGVTFVHGSPRNPTTDYVMPRTAATPGFLEPLFGMFDGVCFVGHSHIPGVFREDGQHSSPQGIDYEYDVAECKAIINVGAVGQPRDGDPRGCFVLFDGEKVRWERFEYDIESACDKIFAEKHLDQKLGQRLRVGR